MSKFGHIFLTWRSGIGKARHVVGVIKSNASTGVSFSYLSETDLKPAQLDGFTSYTEFPDLKKTYKNNVLDIFKQRLFKSERSDFKDFLNFWGIEDIYKDDTLNLLAHTHGMIPTDNFEFLADFNITKNFKLVTEIVGLTHVNPDKNAIKIGDQLIWKRNPTTFDKNQVDVYNENEKLIGWVKKIHSRIFFKKFGDSLIMKVKAIDKNGSLKRIFIEITF